MKIIRGPLVPTYHTTKPSILAIMRLSSASFFISFCGWLLVTFGSAFQRSLSHPRNLRTFLLPSSRNAAAKKNKVVMVDMHKGASKKSHSVMSQIAKSIRENVGWILNCNERRIINLLCLPWITSLVLVPVRPAMAAGWKAASMAAPKSPLTLTWNHLGKALALFTLLGPVALLLQASSRSLAKPLLVASLRCLLQLNLVAGWVLTLLFQPNTPSWTTAAWIVVTSLWASVEAWQRIEYTYPTLRRHLAVSLLSSVTTVLSASAAFGLLGTDTTGNALAWTQDARTWVPVAGMILGNTVTATSLAANAWTSALSTNRVALENYLARGATWREATAPVRANVWRTALTPTLNALSVTGIVHIPGMMTGQLLAGQAPFTAAAYQVIILLLLGTAACIAVRTLLPLVAGALVDKRHDRLRSASLLQQKAQGRSSSADWKQFKRRFRQLGWKGIVKGLGPQTRNEMNEEDPSLQEGVTLDGSRTIIHWKDYRSPPRVGDSQTSASSTTSLSTSYESFPVLDIQYMDVKRARVKLSLQLRPGDRVGLRGPSGIGKSQILRTLAGLEKMSAQSCRLYGLGDWDMPSWRQRVALVPQDRPSDMQGSPHDFFNQVMSFRSQKEASAVSANYTQANTSGVDKLTDRNNQVYDDVLCLGAEWGISATLFKRPWTTLSGGEGQRILLAITVGLKPDCLLLDESFNALDEVATFKVEETLKRLGIPLVLVSHSNAQLERFCNQIIDLVPAGPFTTARRPSSDERGGFE